MEGVVSDSVGDGGESGGAFGGSLQDDIVLCGLDTAKKK